MAENMIKAILVPLIRRFQFEISANQLKNGEYRIDETNWVALSDVNLQLRTVPSENARKDSMSI
jgi:hypothetical protein